MAIRGTDASQNTKETREAKVKEQLGHTNVLNETNGGSMATTDGRFENYDGFVRTTVAPNVPVSTKSKEEEEGDSLLNVTNSATSKAKSSKSDCEDYTDAFTARPAGYTETCKKRKK